VLAVVDFNLKFTYVLAGSEGSAHDAGVFADRLFRLDRVKIRDGNFYLVDVGYLCQPGILPPFRTKQFTISTILFLGMDHKMTKNSDILALGSRGLVLL
jgi:hypothetical protein